MKRRDLLKGIAAAAAVGPAVVEHAVEAAPIAVDERAEALAELREDVERRMLIEQLKRDPAVQEMLRRAVFAKLNLDGNAPRARLAEATFWGERVQAGVVSAADARVAMGVPDWIEST